MTNLQYLDQDIILRVNYIPYTVKGVYPYTLYSVDPEGNVATVFIGNAYLPGALSGQYTKQFDVTDLIRDDKYVPEYLYYKKEQVPVIKRYYLTLNVSGTAYNSNRPYVCLEYRYPRLDAKLNCTYLNYDAQTAPADKICQCLEGFSGSDRQQLYPRIPYIKTDNFGFPLMLEKYSDAQTYTVTLYTKGHVNSLGIDIQVNYCFNHVFVSINDILNGDTIEQSETDTWVTMHDVTHNVGYRIGKVDTDCISRYYLCWQDRSGGFQIQPFDKIDTYSESIETKEVIAYNYKRRLNTAIFQPKFEIQTDYIDEYYYPFYESIFQSPSLWLYDTELDRSYDVIATDKSYIEKTFLNQGRKMFNVKLNLELAKKQIITY